MKKRISIAAVLLLTAALALSLTACGIPSSASAAEKNLKKTGYTVNTSAPQDGAQYGAETVVSAYKTGTDDKITVYYFRTTQSADAALTELKTGKNLNINNSYTDSDGNRYGSSGKAVYVGTPQAIGDLKG